MQGTKRFKEFPELSKDTLKVLKKLGFKTASPVQEACIPLFTGHKDVAVEACTGSGKTFAFILPIIEKLKKLEEPLSQCQVGALVISPTRELAKQIFEVAMPFLKTVTWVKPLLLVGGGDASSDVQAFENNGGNVIISTPGRLLDIIKRSQKLDFKFLEILVLDEADRLLDLGFRKQLDQILQVLPKQRRTGLFSATQTEAVEELARAGLRNPVRVKVAVQPSNISNGETSQKKAQKTPLGLKIEYQICESTEKLGLLLNFLKEHKGEKIIIFALTCALVEYYGVIIKNLEAAKGLKVWTLHGKMKQNQRQSSLQAFASQDAGALICTDVAARGLDIPDVNWILQLDPPQDPDAIVHRVGRTARMGRLGNALLFLLPHEESYAEFLHVRKIPLQLAENLLNTEEDLMPNLRKLSESDRDILEKGIKAFVSYIRGYKEHQCRFIFQLKDLDFGKLAYACGLLQLPRMPEIKKLGGKIAGFTPSDINPNIVEFKDKKRQKLRLEKLKQKIAAREETSQVSKKSLQKEKREMPQTEKHLPSAKRRMIDDRQDVSDFADEYTLLKRLKKGKISEEEFDRATGIVTNDEQENSEMKDDVSNSHRETHQSQSRGQKKSLKRFARTKQKKANFGQRKSGKTRQRPKR